LQGAAEGEDLMEGFIQLDTFVEVLQQYDTQMDEDEVLALVQHWDEAQDGLVNYAEFVDVLKKTNISTGIE
jgi:Ca2+-binding EF-hand superfamily protein